MALPQAPARAAPGRRVVRLALGLSLALATGAGARDAAAQPPPTIVSPPHPAAPAPGAAPSEGVDASLSPECRVPGSKLYSLAKLDAVKAALGEKRPVRVLALGSSSAGLGSSVSYPVKLENALERSLPDVEVEVESRGLPGEIASGAGERLRSMVAEVEPDLVVWQVGTHDALARVDVEDFGEALSESVQWVRSHGIDIVLVDPLYTESLADDATYSDMVRKVQEVADREGVPLVRRYEAMRFLSGSGDRDEDHGLGRQFRLNDLGLRCMAEHVTRAIMLSLLRPGPRSTGSVDPGKAPAEEGAKEIAKEIAKGQGPAPDRAPAAGDP